MFQKGKEFRRSFEVSHTLEGLHSLVEYLDYQTPVVHYLEERGYLLIIINPLISYKARSSSLWKVKEHIFSVGKL